ncbi:GDSL-type esterase/lipase family protein [Mucilaginibacter sp. 10I4]|uniref:GDSL-type esterase/lipase family protein n=1 Tax=Mucilaginibacter sp. 10I4 TaxID=3048580 RepID=UPI002B2295C6|nr:GDSL-type esterase/lipase family protein [Mucilaginibacter sp. 10I4]MEB0262664.1 GDSL-type esterase/lipase family protein [Mucilaginibacter sp. 10I4]
MAADKKISELPILGAVTAADTSVVVHNGTDYQFNFDALLTFINSGINSGATVSFGSTLPQNSIGKNGDLFINTSAGSFAQKASGSWQVKYTLPPTDAEKDGTVLYGSGIPGPGIGNTNDTYINTNTGIFYRKNAGTWAQVFSMQTGPPGARGEKGDKGDSGANGRTILSGTSNPSNLSTGTNGDFYINTNSFQLFGPKTNGVWPAGITIVGISGEQGETGPQGDPGANGANGTNGLNGEGVPTGGTAGHVLAKVSDGNYDTGWVEMTGALPVQSDKAGKYLKTDGLIASWETVPIGSGAGESNLMENQITFGAANGGLAQDDGLRYNPATKSLLIGSPAPYITSGGNIYFYGDSITQGTGSIGGSPFASLVANFLGLTGFNYGVSASYLEKRSPIDPAGASNMIDRLSQIPTKTSSDKFLVFVYGINDVNYGGVNYNPANFQADYTTIMIHCVSKGWSGQDILITSTTYQKPAYYGNVGPGGNVATLAIQQAFDAAALAVSTAFETKYFDVFNYIKDRGGDLNIFDSVHPNAAGHYLMARGIVAKLRPNIFENGQSLTLNGTASIKQLLLSVNNILKDGSYVLGIDIDGNVGIVNSVKTGIRLDGKTYFKQLVQTGAELPDVPGDNDVIIKHQTKIIEKAIDGHEAFIQLSDSGDVMTLSAILRLRLSVLDQEVMYIPHQGWLVVGGGGAFELAPDIQRGDVALGTAKGISASVGNIQGKFIPLTSGNSTVIKNDYSSGRIQFLVSGGSNGAEVNSWNLNPDGSFESVISGKGIILKSPNGTRYKVTIADNGDFVKTLIV